MQLNKKKGQFLEKTIEYWESNSVISSEEADKLRKSFSIRPFQWKKLAKYSFWIAIISIIISFGALVSDEYILELVESFFTAPDIALCIIFAIIAAGIYYWAYRRKKRKPQMKFSNEAIMVGGVLFTAASVAYLGEALDTGSGHFSILILLLTLIYGGIGLGFPSKLVWIFAILSLGSWFGTETGYVSGWGAYYLGMNYPLRFVLFGGVLVGVSLFLKKQPRLSDFFKSTYIMGLLYLFIALWILSIFGNYGDMNSWYNVKQIELFHWGILFGLVAIGAIWIGLKYDDYTSRSFGITFLFLNLYTKFFEYFWDMTHKAIFFALLGISFWLIGRKAEKIWNLEFLHPEKKKETEE